jgi:hypothetical protein
VYFSGCKWQHNTYISSTTGITTEKPLEPADKCGVFPLTWAKNGRNIWGSVSQTFFKWGPLLLVRMFYGPPYSCPLWKQIVWDSQLQYVIRNSRWFYFFCIFWTSVQSKRTTRAEPEDHRLRNADVGDDNESIFQYFMYGCPVWLLNHVRQNCAVKICYKADKRYLSFVDVCDKIW